MTRCGNCGLEVDAGAVACPGCGADLVAQTAVSPGEPVVVLEAQTYAEAQVAEATLEAEGIDALVQDIPSPAPNIGVMGDDVPELEVVVAAEDAVRAQQVLSESAVSDEELAAAAESDASTGQGDAVV